MSPERLRELLHYNPSTGVFTRKVRTAQVSRVGDVAGSLGNRGHIIIELCARRYQASILAWVYMTGRWPADEIDHKDCDPANNRWDNLREATSQQNKGNRRRSVSKKYDSPKGVFWDKNRQKWLAAIGVNGRFKNLGRYADMQEAQAAYERAAKEHFGEFARVA